MPNTGTSGVIWWVSADSKQPVQLRLNDDVLYVQKSQSCLVFPPSLDTDQLDSSNSVQNKERKVEIKREKPGGLGLSVKGGSEHNLPILISRIFKGQAADRTGQLFVGDAILQVNGINVETFCHDEAVTVLKNAGDDVILLVRHFQPASNFLSTKDAVTSNTIGKDGENNRTVFSGNRRSEENGNGLTLTKQTTTLVTVPLLCAFMSRFKPNSAQLSDDTFELMSLDGSGAIELQFDETRTCDDWARNIYRNIVAQNNLSICLTNRQLLQHQHVMHMCWVCEQVSTGSSSTAAPEWRRMFLSLKGPDIAFYEMPPVKTRDWVKCEKSYKIYECIFKIQKGSELTTAGRRPYGFQMETVDGATHVLSVETREEMMKLEKAWYKATYHVIKHQTNKTFGCTCTDRLCGLTLDFNDGFCLYDSQTKACIWSYRFSQLKGSSDNGENVLKLQFLNDSTTELDVWEIQSTELRSLLYCLNAFLSAKLASVDPIFLINLE